jgi:hypothetical protein
MSHTMNAITASTPTPMQSMPRDAMSNIKLPCTGGIRERVGVSS